MTALDNLLRAARAFVEASEAYDKSGDHQHSGGPFPGDCVRCALAPALESAQVALVGAWSATRRPMKFPSIEDVARALRRVNQNYPDPSDPDSGVDVRLQIYSDGDWAVRWGDASYDQDHRGYWGASSVPGGNRRFRSHEVARDLLEQAKEQVSTEADGES